VSLYELVRANGPGAKTSAPQYRWVKDIAERYGRSLSNAEAVRLSEALVGAYGYLDSARSSINAAKFNPSKWVSDWIDYQHLFYLAVDSYYLMTRDGRLRERCSDTFQQSRIVLLDEFLKVG
jgi:hypothetical protein